MTIYEFVSLKKSYGSTEVLTSAEGRLVSGKITAILGGNGAGKTTLLRILSGNLQPDSGVLRIDERAVVHTDVQSAASYGIRTSYQLLSLIPSWAVWEHFTSHRCPWRTTSPREAKALALSLLSELHFCIDVERPIESLSTAEKQAVEIAKAIAGSPEILLVDEPTAGLDQDARKWIYEQLRRLALQDKIVAIVSHDIPAMLNIADDILYLRDGKILFSGTAEQATSLLDYTDLSSIKSPSTSAKHFRNENRVNAWVKAGNGAPIAFTISPGEIVGISGTPRSGADNLLRALIGLSINPFTQGHLSGHDSGTPLWRYARNRIAYVSRERDSEWLFAEHSVQRNLVAGMLSHLKLLQPISNQRETHDAETLVKKFSINLTSLGDRVDTLSGGNQQKAVLARAIAMGPQILLLDEPFSGVDASTRLTLINELRALANHGLSILIFTREYLEASLLATRWIHLSSAFQEALCVDHPLSESELKAANDGLLDLSRVEARQ